MHGASRSFHAVSAGAARAASTTASSSSSSATPSASSATATATPTRPAHAIASLAREESALGVTWGDGAQARFPWVWLRDHCRTGPRAWNAATHQRADATLDAVPADLKPAAAPTLTAAGAVRVAWPAVNGGAGNDGSNGEAAAAAAAAAAQGTSS